MTYKDKINVGEYLCVKSDNPMNSGFVSGQLVVVTGITPSGDPIVRDLRTGHVTSLYRPFLEHAGEEHGVMVYGGDDEEYDRLRRLGL